jgi:hypothetical protein
MYYEFYSKTELRQLHCHYYANPALTPSELQTAYILLTCKLLVVSYLTDNKQQATSNLGWLIFPLNLIIVFPNLHECLRM